MYAVFIFVSCEEKGYYCVVSVGQLSFDCRSYCGRSLRVQGLPGTLSSGNADGDGDAETYEKTGERTSLFFVGIHKH